MLYNYMGTQEQLCYFVDELKGIIRENVDDIDFIISSEQGRLLTGLLFEESYYNDRIYEFEMEFGCYSYLYLVIVHNEVVKDVRRKIKYGFYDEKTYKDLQEDVEHACMDIRHAYCLLTYENLVFTNNNELQEKTKNRFPFINFDEYVELLIRQMCIKFTDTEIKTKINELDYNDFLYSVYWRWVRKQKLKEFGYKCIYCGNTDHLQIHHRNYKRHGLEHLKEVRNNDLMVVCERCHKINHGFIN